jgi:hypothetical protein
VISDDEITDWKIPNARETVIKNFIFADNEWNVFIDLCDLKP